MVSQCRIGSAWSLLCDSLRALHAAWIRNCFSGPRAWSEHQQRRPDNAGSRCAVPGMYEPCMIVLAPRIRCGGKRKEIRCVRAPLTFLIMVVQIGCMSSTIGCFYDHRIGCMNSRFEPTHAWVDKHQIRWTSIVKYSTCIVKCSLKTRWAGRQQAARTKKLFWLLHPCPASNRPTSAPRSVDLTIALMHIHVWYAGKTTFYGRYIL